MRAPGTDGSHPNRVPPNLRSAIYCSMVATGGEDAWNFLWQKFREARVVSEADKLRTALSCSPNPWILSRCVWGLAGPVLCPRQPVALGVSAAPASPSPPHRAPPGTWSTPSTLQRSGSRMPPPPSTALPAMSWGSPWPGTSSVPTGGRSSPSEHCGGSGTPACLCPLRVALSLPLSLPLAQHISALQVWRRLLLLLQPDFICDPALLLRV